MTNDLEFIRETLEMDRNGDLDPEHDRYWDYVRDLCTEVEELRKDKERLDALEAGKLRSTVFESDAEGTILNMAMPWPEGYSKQLFGEGDARDIADRVIEFSQKQ